MSRWRRPRFGLLVLCALLLAATFTRPSLNLERPTYRYVFVFDISQSMNVPDASPRQPNVSRLEYAKQATAAALAAMPCGTEAGLALFSGHRAFLLVTPLEVCANYRELSQILERIDWRMTWEARSEVAKGLYKSIALMTALAAQTRLVFVTDGHEAPPINPEVPPRFQGEAGEVSGLIVGVGGDLPARIPKFGDDGEPDGYWEADDVMHVDTFTAERNAREGLTTTQVGTEHLSALRGSYLQELAARTGLTYLRLSDADDLHDALTRRALGIPRVITTDVRWLYALAALVLLLATALPAPRARQATPE